uniref:Uncharacterized protein n=1 Tax=Romanomermis culicivorax TaxID=13658 RepID=A0A915HWJ0_ROMCU
MEEADESGQEMDEVCDLDRDRDWSYGVDNKAGNSREEEEEEEEKTLNNNISDEEGTLLDYDDDENNQYKSYTSHSSDAEGIYEPGIHNAHQYLKHNDFLKDKCCITQINNTDDLCFARALAFARAHIHKKDPNTVYKWERHLCVMQHVGSEQVEEEDVFETGDEGVNDDNTCLTTEEKVL